MVRYGYDFDPVTMYQPKPKKDVVFVGKVAQIFSDGACLPLGDFVLESENINNYNHYTINECFHFKGYKEIAKTLWPIYPSGLWVVDHVNRISTDDSWHNLRRVNSALNNLNQYRTGTCGYVHETRVA